MKFTSTEATPAPHVPPGVLRLTGAAKEDIPMYHIQTMNKISPVGLNRFPSELYEVGDAVQDPQGILVRSAKLLDYDFPKNLLAISRAGAGVNNIPLDRCSEAGIVVFNTPGANANAVAELVLGALVLGSRNVAAGIRWADTLKGQENVPKLVEKGKGQFVGPELRGKTLGVIGLGAIGRLVANAASAGFGMKVVGCDPFISVESAWALSSSVRRAATNEDVFAQADYITFHVPLNDKTRGSINAATIAKMKKGAILLNFSRGELANTADVKAALASGQLGGYVTDFPCEELLGVEKVTCIPHLGASTPESEDNCARMAAAELRDYLEVGSIRNSVNLPDVPLGAPEGVRVLVIHENVPNMVATITTCVSAEQINIDNLVNKSRKDVAVTVMELSDRPSKMALNVISSIAGVIRVRVFG